MALAAAPIHRLTVAQVDRLVEAGLLEDRRMELVDGIRRSAIARHRWRSRSRIRLIGASEYAHASVPEYWMVDLVAREIVVHRGLIDGVYTEVAHHRDGMLAEVGGGTPIDVGALLAAAG